jgi:hypothetical protein
MEVKQRERNELGDQNWIDEYMRGWKDERIKERKEKVARQK